VVVLLFVVAHIRRRADGNGIANFDLYFLFGGVIRFGNAAERTLCGIVKQKSATLRADTYHWSVLRRGMFQWERTNHSTASTAGKADRKWYLFRIRQPVTARAAPTNIQRCKPIAIAAAKRAC